MTDKQKNGVFGRKSKQHTIIIASGDRIRHLTVRPWMIALAVCFVTVFAIAHLTATTYLVLRDDLIGASMARQARMQHAYEDRIAALRSQVDRVTSRQLLDQQMMEAKVQDLVARQAALNSRSGRLGPLLDRAMNSGLAPMNVPVPQPKPGTGSPSNEAALQAIDSIRQDRKKIAKVDAIQTGSVASAFAPSAALSSTSASRLDRLSAKSRAFKPDAVFEKVALSIESIEREQISHLQGLAFDANHTAGAIQSILRKTGVNVPEMPAQSAIGGPFVEADGRLNFEHSVAGLDSALGTLEMMRNTARRLPFASPTAGTSISSRFGKRRDPFLRRIAMHSGIDFRGKTGTPVYATGAGRVLKASRQGGYGNMVEIDHGHGIVTRYAHLSRILVRKGERVEAKTLIGKIGSTGRSTGPHLHYEVRRHGKAINPMQFLAAGYKLKPLISG